MILSPLTVHTLGVREVRVTVKPELEVAPEAKVVDCDFVPGLAKVMTCELNVETGNS